MTNREMRKIIRRSKQRQTVFFLYAWEAIKVTAFTIGVLVVFYWFTVFMFLAEGVR